MARGKYFEEKGLYVMIGLILILAIFAAHVTYMEQKIVEISKSYLTKITAQCAMQVSSDMDNSLEMAHVLARVIGSSGSYDLNSSMELLEGERNRDSVLSMGVVLKDGSCRFTQLEGEAVSGDSLLLLKDWDYINQVLMENPNPTPSVVRTKNNQQIFVYACPIYQEHSLQGAFVILFRNTFFQELSLPEILENGHYVYLAEKDGTVVYRFQNEDPQLIYGDILPNLENDWSIANRTGDFLKEDIQRGNTGSFKDPTSSMYVSYTPVGFRDWYLINVTPISIAEADSHSLYREMIPMLFYIVLIIGILSAYFFYQKRERVRILEENAQLSAVSEESYRMIMERTNDVIFEYDAKAKTYLHTENFRKSFGYEPNKDGFLVPLQPDYIHSDDLARFAEKYEQMRLQRTMVEFEARIVTSQGDYLWCRIHMLGIFDAKNQLVKVIGKIVNVDEKKRQILHLQEMAVKDGPTGVYNKQATERLIRQYLSDEGQKGIHALLVIDIDDFKEVNDDYGHRRGDEVIAFIGAELNRLFRTSDIKGRIGGDEFMVLVKDIEGIELLREKASNVCKSFKDKNKELFGEDGITLSASIGIATYPKDGNRYEELYEAADQALYHCKNLGKGNAILFGEIKNSEDPVSAVEF